MEVVDIESDPSFAHDGVCRMAAGDDSISCTLSDIESNSRDTIDKIDYLQTARLLTLQHALHKS
jgi:hypothetical protein